MINFKLLREISGGDISFKKEVIAIFQREAIEFENYINSTAFKKDLPGLKKKAHKFKSSVMLFGINPLIRLLNEFENAAFEKLPQEKKTRLAEKAGEILGQCNKELARELKKLS